MWAILLVLILNLVFEISKPWLAFAIPSQPQVLTLTILDASTTVALVVGLLTILVMRNQFAMGLRPYIVYSGEPLSQPVSAINGIGVGGRFWSVTIKNVGGGLAIIDSAEYRLRLRRPEITQHLTSYRGASQALQNIGLEPSVDFSLAAFSKGTAFPSGYSTWLFEAPVDKLENVERLDITIQIRGVLGDRYKKSIYCIPRDGLDGFVSATDHAGLRN